MKWNLVLTLLILFLGLCPQVQATEDLTYYFTKERAPKDQHPSFLITPPVPRIISFNLYDVLPDVPRETVIYKFIRKYSYRIINKFARPYIRDDYNNFFLNSLKPHQAQEEYQKYFPTITTGYRPYAWLTGSTVLRYGNLVLTDAGQVGARIDLRSLNRRFSIFRFGIWKTKVRFRVKLGSSGLIRSFGIRMSKSFSVLEYLCNIRVSYKHDFEDKDWNAEFLLRVV